VLGQAEAVIVAPPERKPGSAFQAPEWRFCEKRHRCVARCWEKPASRTRAALLWWAKAAPGVSVCSFVSRTLGSAGPAEFSSADRVAPEQG
jgi:hypothetical protein